MGLSSFTFGVDPSSAGRYDQKCVYHSIFQNSNGFTVYDGIFFSMHNQAFTAFSTS